ncbi:MAG: hypothetical protein NE330_21600, partial [Lentisphaeraceae bacterium]|nr:hypothetical protein [Lentisphaeraceae bacterium]
MNFREFRKAFRNSDTEALQALKELCKQNQFDEAFKFFQFISDTQSGDYSGKSSHAEINQRFITEIKPHLSLDKVTSKSNRTIILTRNNAESACRV